MPYPEDLLEQGRHLARREPKRPKQASLRRSVSSAYYALFHLLISETTKNWKRPAERDTLARMFDHGTMGRVCSTKRGDLREYFKTNPAAGPERDLKQHLFKITNTFIQMLEKRHIADSDNSFKWTRVGVWEELNAVTEAFASWKAIKDHPEAQHFLATLLLKERRS